MKNKYIKKCLKLLLTILITLTLYVGAPYAQSEEVTLVGEINDTCQLVAQGEIYDIDDTPLGNDLVQNYISIKVKVNGTTRPGNELKVITVKSFEAVEE
jgi:hypothetical protein